MLFSKRKKPASIDSPGVQTQLDAALARESIYQQLHDKLLGWLGDFALQEEELDVAGFRAALKTLRSHLRGLQASAEPGLAGKHTAFIPGFIARQQQHLEDRDQELRDVVSVLTGALIDMNSRNDAYNFTVQEQIESISALTRLEDIRKLRSALAAEIAQLRELQQKKQAAEARSIESLTSQVTSLRSELEVAQETSRRDGLTGAYNRRALDDFLASQLDARGSRKGNFVLLLLDLDDFKAINDNFGHPMGDRVLRAVVEICRGVIRSEDFFARFGGDEFAVVFPGASTRIATRKGNDICRILESRIFKAEATAARPETRLSLSVSIGVTARKASDTATTLLERADAALYQAKREGKNRVRSG